MQLAKVSDIQNLSVVYTTVVASGGAAINAGADNPVGGGDFGGGTGGGFGTLP